MADFDERRTFHYSSTDWGRWGQTVDEVVVEVHLQPGTRARQIRCDVTTSALSCVVCGKTVVKGELKGKVVADDTIWTVENEGSLLRVSLTKVSRGADNCWPSLLTDEYNVDPFTLDKMQQDLTLQRFQLENPGMDFSGADISGNYQSGGPKFPTS